MIKVRKLLHASINVANEYEGAKDFYGRILGLPVDPKRPDISGIPGQWLNVGSNQIHVIAREQALHGLQGGRAYDIAGPHIALAVEDLDEAKRVLEQEGYGVFETRIVGGIRQVFVHDPAGNLIELQQAR